jgi:hypothetical protein
LHKLLYLTPNCDCIDTFIPIHCFHMANIVNGRNFYAVKNLIMARCLKRMSSHPSTSTGTEMELWTAVGSRLCMVEGRHHMTVWNWFYSVFVTLNKKYDRRENFSARTHINQFMHLIKYNSWQVSNSYMFRHRSAILRDSSRTKDYISNILI